MSAEEREPTHGELASAIAGERKAADLYFAAERQNIVALLTARQHDMEDARAVTDEMVARLGAGS